MLKRALAATICSSLLWLTANADAAMMAYLTLKGQKSGQVKGSITQKGREDSIGVLAMAQSSAVSAGKLRVGQVILTKEVDRSSPILRQMLDTQENITEATIRFWTPQIKAGTGVGSEVQYYTLRLTKARIVYLKTTMDNIRDPSLVKYAIHEDVGLAFERAEWIWSDGGIMAMEMGGAEQVK